jgi:glycosyltransferase involved in cell wall biosynthesis
MDSSNRTLRVALVHDWLTGMRGGEKCLEVLCELYPNAPIYTLLHAKGTMSPLIESKEIHTSFVQHFPRVEQKYRVYLPVFPFAIESFDFSQYDLIISTSHCVAKGAIPRNDALHICYCFTPMRYVYEMYDEYFGKGQAGTLTRAAMRVIAPPLRRWDKKTANRVHHYVAISEHIRKRIQRHYHHEAEVIFPPVDTERFQLSTKNDGYHLIVSALVPYKRVDLAIHAFNKSGARLIVVGKGPDEVKLRRIANSTIEFVGWKRDNELAQLYAGCTALVFPGEEDFGIVPLEAMACGKPVIAFGKGGVLETVQEGISGIFFPEQTIEALENAIAKAASIRFDGQKIRRRALHFSRNIYKEKMKKFIEEKIEGHFWKASSLHSPSSINT